MLLMLPGGYITLHISHSGYSRLPFNCCFFLFYSSQLPFHLHFVGVCVCVWRKRVDQKNRCVLLLSPVGPHREPAPSATDPQPLLWFFYFFFFFPTENPRALLIFRFLNCACRITSSRTHARACASVTKLNSPKTVATSAFLKNLAYKKKKFDKNM